MIKTAITPTTTRNGYHLHGRLGVAITSLLSHGEQIGVAALVAITALVRDEIKAFDDGCAQCVGARPAPVTTKLKSGRTVKSAYESDYGWDTRAVIEHFGLGFSLGNVCKYLCRCTSVQHDNALKYKSDLDKCVSYLLDAIDARVNVGSAPDSAKHAHLVYASTHILDMLANYSGGTDGVMTAKSPADTVTLQYAAKLAKLERLG